MKRKTKKPRSGIGRELNLTWLEQAPAQNEIIAGEWFGDNATAEASVEESMLERLDVKLGRYLDLFNWCAIV